MTGEEIMDEIQKCREEIDRLLEEAENEEDTKVRFAKYDEAIELTKRIGELDTMNKNRLMDVFKEATNKMLNMFIKHAN